MKGYKTIVFGLMLALLPILDNLTNSGVFAYLIADKHTLEIVTSVVGTIVMALRLITTTPAFQKAAQDAGVEEVVISKPTSVEDEQAQDQPQDQSGQ